MQPGAEVCPGCGKAVVPQYTPDPFAGEPGAFQCYRHRRVATRLRCGRCGRAICPDCAIIGPAGPRCPDCGRHKVPVSARAVAHETKVALRGLFSGPFRFIWLFLAIGLVFSAVRGCQAVLQQREGPVPVDQPFEDTEAAP